jgi:hypothetical protein
VTLAAQPHDSVAAPRYLLGRVSEARLPTCHFNFQGGNNVKASLGICFALSRNYVSSYRGTAIMRKKMHATVFSIRYRRGNSPERLHVEVYECAGEMPRLKLGRPVYSRTSLDGRCRLGQVPGLPGI